LAHLLSSVRGSRVGSLWAPFLAYALAWTEPANAAQPLDLSWQAPPGCPQESAVRDQIRALVPSAMLESGSVRAEGTITRVDKRFRLNLVLHLGDVSGERSIDSDSCSDLAGAAAVALGLLLQSATQPTTGEPGGTSAAGGDGSSSPGASAEPPKPPPAPVDSGGSTTRPAPPTLGNRTPRAWHLFVTPQFAVDLGPMPKPTVGLAVAAGLSAQSWRFSATFELPQHQQLLLPDASGAGAELKHWAVEAWACRAWRSPGLELAPCLLVGWERLTASGSGPSVTPRSVRASWGSIGVAAVGRWYVADWFAFAASAGAKVESARPTIRIDGLEGYARLEPLDFTLRIGPMWIF